MTKANLLIVLKASYLKLEALLAALSEVQMSQAGVYDKLSIKDVLAHLAAWERLVVDWIETSQRGELTVRYSPGFELVDRADAEQVMDRLNEHVYLENKDRPFNRVRADLLAGHQRLVMTVEGMSEQDLTEPGRFQWWPGRPVWEPIAANSYEHYREHIELIESWLEAAKTG